MEESYKKSQISLQEEEILAMWNEKKIFEKSLEQTQSGTPFVFYDGPPFANGLPHYGHILTSVIKDVVGRYQTMRGNYVRRVWGWDCHGLPIENAIEQELNLKNKKDIVACGIDTFNNAAHASVLRYEKEWKKIIPRIGRWIDMEHSYTTMDSKYTESVWWAFKTLYDTGLIYQGFYPMHVCPRCETTLSNNEVAGEYKDITDISVTAAFELTDTPGTYILAWTTTPWTLPGNVALAINPKEKYVEVVFDNKRYIVAHARVEVVFKGKEYMIAKIIAGSDLISKSYIPLFDYYSTDIFLTNYQNGWKIYGADFVTMETGTGIVHIAPAFGDDDMTLGKREKLPFVQHVGMDGLMKSSVRDFAGLPVKPKGDHQATDILIIKHLAHNGALFLKEKIIHSYPHCWRCDTPLLNYAAESWFVKVTALQEKLLSENLKTVWVPENMRDGRFGNWLASARDWAISRSRYWGAPLPVWKCMQCPKQEIIGSRGDLSAKTKKTGNRYLIMRHGVAGHNVKNVINSSLNNISLYGLTEEGVNQVKKTSAGLATIAINHIFTSPFLRTIETARIVAKTIGFNSESIVIEERLREVGLDVLEGKSIDEYHSLFPCLEDKFFKNVDGVENLFEVKRRVMEFLEECENTYKDATILIITHEYPAWMLSAGSLGSTALESVALKKAADFVGTGEVFELPFTLFPHNRDFEFNMHMPFIDRLPVFCQCGHRMMRTPYVFDCWFESGSMPYAQFHYPFENKELFEKNFPADFIAEGQDQTRGWFYNMLVLSVGLFDKAPFKNVLVNGMILARDGQKMSKKLKNYADPVDLINQYGSDALRYYLLGSPVTHAEDIAFSEAGVNEVVKKIILRLSNVLSFYKLQGESRNQENNTTIKQGNKNPLDSWILLRLTQLSFEITTAFDSYKIDSAVKPIAIFVDDFSTWYVRRSRDRFKSDDVNDRTGALDTIHSVLLEFSKLIAPLMPFIAEQIYQTVGGEKESVHLESWPTTLLQDNIDLIIKEMDEVRRIVSLALELRASAGIKVRQPLQSLTVKSSALQGKQDLILLITDEVNVKEIIFDPACLNEVTLDTGITPALKQEGRYRELLRMIQDLRKSNNLILSDEIIIHVQTNDEGQTLINTFSGKLKKIARIRDFVFVVVANDLQYIDGIPFFLSITK